MLSWFVCRHVFFIMVCYSVWAQSSVVIPPSRFRGPTGNLTGPFPPPSRDGLSYMLEPFTQSDGLICFEQRVKWAFLSALLALQLIMMVWFTMIVQVAVRVIRGDGADDSRSDGEVDDEDDEDEERDMDDRTRADEDYYDAPPLEEEVGVDQLDLKGWERRAGLRRHQASSATGVSLPGHSDRKELLGRIGCEKQVD